MGWRAEREVEFRERSGCPQVSKRELESELHRTGTTLLILRRDGSETRIQHLGRLTKGGIGIRWIDIPKVWMVEQIEGLRAEVEHHHIMQREVASDSQIDLRDPRSLARSCAEHLRLSQ
jgi:hypothetical protein